MTSIEQPQPTSRLLDISIVIAGSWKSLLFVPLLAGVFGFGFSKLEQPTYQSTAKLIMLQGEGTAFSPDLVSQALKSVPRAPAVNDVLAGLKTGDSVPRSKNTASVSVTLTLPDQTLVQPTLNAVLREYQKQYLGSVMDETRSDLKVQIDVLNEEIAGSVKAINRLEKYIDLHVSRYVDPAALLSSIVLLEARIEELELRHRTINRRIALLADFLVTNKPSPAVKATGSRPLTVTIFAVFAAIAIIGIFLFTRERVRSLANVPGEAEKIRRIQTAFGLRPRAATRVVPSSTTRI